MLKSKQVGPLSQYARTFFVGGSRGSTSDGGSHACYEEEPCVSRKQLKNNEAVHMQKDSKSVPNSSARVGNLLSGDAVGSVGYSKAESGTSPDSVAHAVSASNSSLGKSSVISVKNDVFAVQKDVVDSPAIVTDHFVKAGIKAVSILSDLVNYKLPTLDGNEPCQNPQNSMVDPTRPIIRSSNLKPHKRVSFSAVHGKPSVEVAGVSDTAVQSHAPKDKAEKSDSRKASHHVPSKATINAVGTHSVPSGTRYIRQSMPQRSTTASYQTTSKSKTGRAVEQKATGGITGGNRFSDKFSRPQRHVSIQTGIASSARNFPNAGHAVDRVCHILQQLKWGPAAESALEKLNFTLDAYQANQILKQLQDYSVALEFFYWLKRRAEFKHDGHSYTTMVGILGRARKFGHINRLLDEMVKDGCSPNVVTYNRLIHSYGRANYLKEAINVFYQMQEAGCEPDRVTYCTLIDIHAKAGYLDVAMDMYQRMQEAGLSPDTFTYSVIINCLGKAGHLAAAYKLFCEMVAQGCDPNLVTYNIMIALQAKARNYTCALKLYRDMQTAGFQPDKVTYSIVMEVLGHCGYLEEAEDLFAEMKQKNWVPDEPVYGLLVDLWGKSGNVDKARGWYQAMLDAGLRPNVPTCNSLLSAFLRMYRFSDAYDVLKSMLRFGLHPSLQTYTLLLSCCTDTSSLGDMGFCCELMEITGHPAHAFLLSMPASEPDGQNVRSHASHFLDLMHSEDRESKRGLVDAVIDFLHKSGLKEEAGSVWEVAAQKNVYPDVLREKSSCYWLINLHVMSDGTAVTALSRTLAWFRKNMLLSGKGPSRIDIVTGWGRRSRVTGSSLVRQSVQDLLHMFRFPFFTENGNSGCFVGCGEPLNQWLLHSYVERMHLL